MKKQNELGNKNICSSTQAVFDKTHQTSIDVAGLTMTNRLGHLDTAIARQETEAQSYFT